MEKEGRRNILWNNFSSHHAFTTGRHQRQTDSNFGNKIRPKGPSQTLKVNICATHPIHTYTHACAFRMYFVLIFLQLPFHSKFGFLFRSQQPGKLNLKNFAIVNDALARMNVNSDNNMQEGDTSCSSKNKKLSKNSSTKKSNTSKSKTKHSAPLAAPEDDSDDLAEYAQVKDVYGLDGVVGPTTGSTFFSHDGTSTSTTSKSNSKTRHRRDKGPSTHLLEFFVYF